MVKKKSVISSLASLGLVIGLVSGRATAQMPHDMNETQPHQTEQTGQFRRIEQPLSNKIAVTVGGLGLIGLELWWFLLSKPKSRKATTQGGVQEVTVTVDGGYEPSQIVVQAGQPVRLNFDRRDPSSCLEEVRFPDFRIAQELPLNQVTSIEFTPNKPGQYEFTCGMNMFRGVVDVQPEDVPGNAPGNAPKNSSGNSSGNANVNVVSTTSQSSPRPAHSPSAEPSVEAKKTSEGTQDATIIVEKGYAPKRVIVEAGYPTRLHIQRNNTSPCYDHLLIPDFAIAITVPPNQTTTIEFTPKQPGEYEFMCGMKMNRGVIEVRPANPSSVTPSSTKAQLAQG